MPLHDLVARIPGFSGWSHAERIRLFAWYLHADAGRDRFTAGDIASCYAELSLAPPSSISPFLHSMEVRKPKQLLRDPRGYYLERSVHQTMGRKYGQRAITIEVTKMLVDLPSRVPDVAEREFLNEALICYRNGAFRAAIVMAWNLAFDHLLTFVLKHHLASFNRQWPATFAKQHQKARVQAISTRDDFSELRESEVLTICKSARIISPDLYRILDEKLGRRNTAAHPSTVTVSQIQAEGVIDDLVNNVVLALTI